MSLKKRLVIIGAGFGGLNLARKVDKRLYDVVIVDRNNYHSFPPLFYQVASSGLEPSSISFPLRRELRGRKYRGCVFHLGKVESVDTVGKKVHTSYETIDYDILVVAAGTTNNFFGIDDLRRHVYTIKSTVEAIRCRNEVLDRLERASLCRQADERRRLLTFVVVGGGPAGVEIAGALGEMKRFIVKREYPLLDPSEIKVIIVEGSDALLKNMGERSSADALEGLRQLLVDVQLGQVVKGYDGRTLSFADGATLDTYNVIWTAGVMGVDIDFDGGSEITGPGKRLPVDAYCRVHGLTDVYAIGDIALMADEAYPKGHPQVAQVALQQGEFLAAVLSNPGGKPEPFKYCDKGSMATIGRNRAVVNMGKLHFSGRMAWLVWLFVHLASLLGMRNKTVVFIDWVWNYFTFSGGLRLLFRPRRYPDRTYWDE